jgi:YggT family protein
MSSIEIVAYLIDAYSIIILARVILSWFMMNPSSRGGLLASTYQALFQITEPLLSPIRRIMPRTGMVDLSPMIAIILLWIIRALIVSLA